MSDSLERLIDDIKASRKYRNVSTPYITSLAAQELAKGRPYIEALKATRNKLHQVGAAYLDVRMAYDAWLNELQSAVSTGQPDTIRETCRRIMSHHASSRERSDYLELLYTTIFNALPPIHSVLDVACGLNPLALPWMHLQPGATYWVADIFEDLLQFVCSAIQLLGYQPVQVGGNILDCHSTCTAVDLALLMKTIPCLEQVDKSAGSRLLRELPYRYAVITYPLHSLGGRSKGMATYYESQFYKMVSGTGWNIKQLFVPGEMVFLIDRSHIS